MCEELAQGCYPKAEWTGVEPTTLLAASQCSNHYITRTMLGGSENAQNRMFQCSYLVSHHDSLNKDGLKGNNMHTTRDQCGMGQDPKTVIPFLKQRKQKMTFIVALPAKPKAS